MSARVRLLSVWIGLAAGGCSFSPIVPTRLEPALATTFANLVHLQVALMRLSPIAASEFAVQASCRKLLGDRNVGSGDWMCTIVWRNPDRRQVRDTYDLFVTADGCYTATIEGETLGGPTLRTRDGREVKNLLHTFEGCFDTTSPTPGRLQSHGRVTENLHRVIAAFAASTRATFTLSSLERVGSDVRQQRTLPVDRRVRGGHHNA